MKKEAVIYHYGYFRRAGRLRLLSRLVLPVLVLFAALTFFFFRSELTADHFRYLIRNFEWNPNSVATSGDTIYYNGDRDSVFGFVAGGLACVNDTRVFVTDSRSSLTLSDYHGFTAPRALFSDKYMLLYDASGNTVAVYSAFARLKTLSYGGRITGAAVADDGTFAVAVAEEESAYTTVYVYNKSFEQVNKLSKYKYVTSLALTQDGETLALSSVYSGDDGLLATEMLLLKVGQTTATATKTYTGVTAWQVAFGGEENPILFCDDGVRFFNEKGKELRNVAYTEAPIRFFCGENGVVLVFSEADSRHQTLCFYDSEGKEQGTYALSSRCISLCEARECVFLLSDESLLSFSEGHLKSQKALTGTGCVLISAEDTVYVAGASVAKRVES